MDIRGRSKGLWQNYSRNFSEWMRWGSERSASLLPLGENKQRFDAFDVVVVPFLANRLAEKTAACRGPCAKRELLRLVRK